MTQKPSSMVSNSVRNWRSLSRSAASARWRSLRSSMAPIMRRGCPASSRSTVPRSNTSA